ncbi:MAG: hypothetical protein QF921_04350 [Pseudomonadales bacterium]|nr:hypothetical protein [Pseudomonadales bacterium]MDP6471052.1 hypothetical protein [Pseudomonadales bacterium]MDP6825762.1 hypothetical protein [Pseudomonadales bacterium]MDP6970733.1 hypothetical protein [Pseudomonadales bacterium]
MVGDGSNKEPVEPEYAYLRRDHVLLCYLHLAALPELTRVLIEKKLTGYLCLRR